MAERCEIVSSRFGGYTCPKCKREWGKHPGSPYCPAEGFYARWSDVPKTLKSVGQWKKEGKRPRSDAVAKAWVFTYMYGSGHFWANLWSDDQVAPIKKRSAESIARAKATARANRTCVYCKRVQDDKITRQDKLCDDCARKGAEIDLCRAWLLTVDDCVGGPIILDTETTGLDDDAEIIQIAIVTLKGRILLDTYVRPQDPIREVAGHWEETDWGDERYYPSSYEINGITNEHVRHAPTLPELWPLLWSLTVGRGIIAYNADFDSRMMRINRKRWGLHPLARLGWRCAMEMYAAYVGEKRRRGGYYWHKLREACEWEKVEVDYPIHSCAGDCLRTLGLIKAVAAKEMPVGLPVKGKGQ